MLLKFTQIKIRSRKNPDPSVISTALLVYFEFCFLLLLSSHNDLFAFKYHDVTPQLVGFARARYN